MMNLIFFKKFMYLFSLNKYFYMMLFFSLMIIVSSSSWLGVWLGMEMNLLFFIPLLMNNVKMSKYINSSMMYYIIQVGSSSMMLMIILMMKINLILMEVNLMVVLLQISLIFKLGASPFHWWLVKIMNSISWLNLFILSTLQKVGPLFLLVNLNVSFLVYFSMMLSGLFGSFLGFNQVSLKLIMGYSSVNHMSWMFMSLMIDSYILLIYMMIYFLNNLIICMFFYYFNLNYLNQVYMMNNLSYFMKLLLLMMFLSMAGIPPMIGFLPKFFVFMLMIKNLFYIECLIFIFYTLVVLFYYMNLILPLLLTLKFNLKFNLNYLKLNFYYFLIFMLNIFLMMLIYMMMIYYFN
uniref:NADH dehydrogenase subunit 2 n=1 Tax=Neodiprion huizeensis TaxID=2980995 RepID=UPI0023F0A759|nr:NADH dehydrogenase subunit 2 [Neodiprion huizeensis]WDY84640.1 NADH dehydrogenase subunit 2 [Neodiprion huizeensis]